MQEIKRLVWKSSHPRNPLLRYCGRSLVVIAQIPADSSSGRARSSQVGAPAAPPVLIDVPPGLVQSRQQPARHRTGRLHQGVQSCAAPFDMRMVVVIWDLCKSPNPFATPKVRMRPTGGHVTLNGR